MTNYRESMDRICIDYNRVHRDTKSLFDQLKHHTEKGAVLVAVARGGWLTTRILAASYEELNIVNQSYSLSATYKNQGSVSERVELTQILDNRAILDIQASVDRGMAIVITDSVCQTGRELSVVKQYIRATFPKAKIYIVTMIQVQYKKSDRTPWRSVELTPDFYGSLIENEQMPYIEFPWEFSSIKDFNSVKE